MSRRPPRKDEIGRQQNQPRPREPQWSNPNPNQYSNPNQNQRVNRPPIQEQNPPMQSGPFGYNQQNRNNMTNNMSNNMNNVPNSIPNKNRITNMNNVNNMSNSNMNNMPNKTTPFSQPPEPEKVEKPAPSETETKKNTVQEQVHKTSQKHSK